ncbi:MAG: pyridine nucleotide-disulfide oxidoreductase [Polyangiaceae bacterium UTPRO1]|jgi:NADPH-dependent 2,4-dienoyl-CoA reductase/sulfur reductase-like enzyme|nr:FAD-dependent oxidoreductase [Myxococcales bacterium]OQY65734.1 MAG: pyridine nucleotide-disulfide oxidoreductase [Polyangiaceae bacterium UTPRO1]
MQHVYDYLIVGAGLAGEAAAQAIRGADDQGTIGMLGDEAHPPYDRPPLSKALWKDGKEDDIWRPIAKARATVQLGRRARTIDRAAHVVHDDAGDTWQYKKLLLATGGTPRTLPFGEGFIYLRTYDDYKRLRAAAKPGARIAVIGGGFIGSEIAAAMAINGCKTTMLFPGNAIGARAYPAALAAAITDYYRERGVDVRSGTTATGGRADGDGAELVLSDGSTLRADTVVAGLGIVPNVQLAQAAGLQLDQGGIAVDEHLQTSDPDIYAAGDVAAFPAPALERRVRVEHENAAATMGEHAGLCMTGRNAPYDELPFFYSDLFDLGYEAVGILDARLETVEQWVTPFREGVVYYLDGGRVRGVLLWNTWGQVDAARALIAAPGPFTAATVRGRLPVAG